MVCRTRTDNSALITVAQREHDLDDGQVTGLFHKLQRIAKQYDTNPPTREEYAEFLDEEIEKLHRNTDSSMTQARRNSIEQRLLKAKESADLPDGPMWYAQCTINRNAGLFKNEQSDFIARAVERSGMNYDELEARYHAYRKAGVPEGAKRIDFPPVSPDFHADSNSQ